MKPIRRSKKDPTTSNMMGLRYRFDGYMRITCIIYAMIQIGCYADESNASNEQQKPNIIVILADDMVDKS